MRGAAAIFRASFRKRRPAAAQAAVPHSDPRTPVLLVSVRESDSERIVKALGDSRYLAVRADDMEEAGRLLSHVVFPIILYDCRGQSADWQAALDRLIGAWRRPSILLLAESCRREFWEDAICRGAFDVLSPSFEPEDLLMALDFAHTNWKLGLSRRPSSLVLLAAAGD